MRNLVTACLVCVLSTTTLGQEPGVGSSRKSALPQSTPNAGTQSPAPQAGQSRAGNPAAPSGNQAAGSPNPTPQANQSPSFNLSDQQPATAPPTDTGSSFNLNDLDSMVDDDLDLDSNQSFDFGDSEDFGSTGTTSNELQSSIASNSNFRGASPQMIGDFGGGSTIFTIGGLGDANALSLPIPFAGGSRRIKIAENNQVTPLDRVYGTFNYFHNAYPVIGAGEFVPGTAVTQVESESLIQYTFGVEKTFFDNFFSVDLRMPFTSGIDQFSLNPGTVTGAESAIEATTGEVGNLATTIKAYLLQSGQTSISGGLTISMPTGSGVEIDVAQETFVGSGVFNIDEIDIDNNSLHLMPFIGAYRPLGDSWWLQSFLQIDTPTSGNEVRTNGVFRGYLNEQTLLYADVSLGKWLYRNRCNSHRFGGRGITGIASIIELHYTTSLNDADGLLLGDTTTSSVAGFGGAGYENRFDVLNLTLGLQTEFSERWRVNVAGVLPLREGRFEGLEGRREDKFFDGELSVQINRFF